MSDILTEIKKAREKKRLSQTDVAKELGIGLRQYQNIEAGQFPKYKKEQIKLLDEILGEAFYERIYAVDVHHKEALMEDTNDYREKYIAELLESKQSLKENNEFLKARMIEMEVTIKRYQAAVSTAKERFDEIAKNQSTLDAKVHGVVEVLFDKLARNDKERLELLSRVRTLAVEKELANTGKGNNLKIDN